MLIDRLFQLIVQISLCCMLYKGALQFLLHTRISKKPQKSKQRTKQPFKACLRILLELYEIL